MIIIITVGIRDHKHGSIHEHLFIHILHPVEVVSQILQIYPQLQVDKLQLTVMKRIRIYGLDILKHRVQVRIILIQDPMIIVICGLVQML